ncbi:MAG: MFS transporter [Erythrobacter sp.]
MKLFRPLNVAPLCDNPAFRRLWAGSSWQVLGGQVLAFAILYQMWEMTGSTLMSGAVGMTLAVPMVVFGIWGGVLADTQDRRALILIANLGTILFALCLVGQALIGWNSPAFLLTLAAAQAGSLAIGQPSRKAMIPDLLTRGQLGEGIALTHASFQVAMLVGPALAGVLAGIWGVAGCYALGTLAFALAFYGLLALPKTPHRSDAGENDSRAMAGLRAIWKQEPLRGSLLTDLAAMLLAMPIALFPALNEARFGGTPETLGLFLSALAAGGIMAMLLSGAVTRHPRQGVIQIGAAALWGLAVAAAGFVETEWATLVCLAAAGAADTVAAITRGAVVQLSCAPEMRGRVLAAEQVVGVAAPQIGNFGAGSMGAVLPPGVVLACGGVLCIVAVTGIAITHPALRHFRGADPS